VADAEGVRVASQHAEVPAAAVDRHGMTSRPIAALAARALLFESSALSFSPLAQASVAFSP
jgi:hypothetical protein